MGQGTPATNVVSREWRWRILCCFLGLSTVGPLVAWMLGLGAFWIWWVAFAVPGMIGLVVIWAWPGLLARYPTLRVAFVSGTVGGLVGTLGYDIFRVPFAAAGIRVFAPISSFGILMLDADSSTPATEFFGWLAHFTDGIGFGIAYAMVALGRRWWWGALWGVALEATTLITPYADTYNLTGHWDLIAIALFAHLAYGAPLGYLVERGHWLTKRLDEASRQFVPLMLGIALFLMVIWMAPWESSAIRLSATEQRAGVDVVINNDRFVPVWSRVPVGSCIVVSNHDDVDHEQVGAPKSNLEIDANGTAKMCFDKASVYRVKLSNKAYSGGFILVDDEY